MNTCHVADQYCGILTRCKCHVCGNPVCRPCSIRMLYGWPSIVARICHHCIEDIRPNYGPTIVDEHLKWLGEKHRSTDQLDRYHPFGKPSFHLGER